MKTLLALLLLSSCTTTKTTSIARTDSGKTFTEVTAQKVDAPSVLSILKGVVSAATTIIGL
jgi:hypothetical protein